MRGKVRPESRSKSGYAPCLGCVLDATPRPPKKLRHTNFHKQIKDMSKLWSDLGVCIRESEAQLIDRSRCDLWVLTDDALFSILNQLRESQLVAFMVACLPKRRHVLLRQFVRGRRVEIGSRTSSGFGCTTPFNHLLVHGNVTFLFGTRYGCRGRDVCVMDDWDNLLKLVLMLQSRGEDLSSSKTVEDWRRELVRLL